MEALQGAIERGDRHALEELYTRNTGLLYKLARRYRGADRAVDLDDLIQAGYLGLVEATAAWEPERGPWITIAALYVRRAMRAAVGLHGTRIRAERDALSLDMPLGEDADMTLLDTLEDKAAPGIDAALLRDDLRREMRAAVRALKDEQARRAVWRCDIETQRLQHVGDQMGMNVHQVKRLRDRGSKELRKNARVRALAKAYDLLDEQTRFYQHKGVAAFRRDMTSTTEAAALWRIENFRMS